jgi:hypothetical protein
MNRWREYFIEVLDRRGEWTDLIAEQVNVLQVEGEKSE